MPAEKPLSPENVARAPAPAVSEPHTNRDFFAAAPAGSQVDTDQPLDRRIKPRISQQLSPAAALALELAAEGVLIPSEETCPYILPDQLKAISKIIRLVHQEFETASRSPLAIGAGANLFAAEWLLDNYYIIQRAIQQIQRGIPRDFYQRLPKASFNDAPVMARISILAGALVSASAGSLEAEELSRFIKAYQSIWPLKIGEVWAFATMLRLSVVEMLAGALFNLRTSPAASAHLPGSQIKADDEGLASLSKHSWMRFFYPEQEPGLFHPLPVLHLNAAAEGAPAVPAPDDGILVSNCITSLRLLDTCDWKAFFEETSLLENVLNADPAGVYPKMDFDTRNHYRNGLEELSLHSPLAELEIAQVVVNLAEKSISPLERHVGYFIIGAGRHRLEAACHYRNPISKRLKRGLMRCALPIYLGSILALTLVFNSFFAGFAIWSAGSPFQIGLAVLLGLLPACAGAVQLVHWLVAQTVPPNTLPKLELKDGIPPECSTMVVIPSLLKNENEMGVLLSQLENHFIGNHDPHIHFALLTDFSDAPQKEMPGEPELMEKTIAGIDGLNAKLGTAAFRPFLLFHRERIWNPGENCWMGWERKRGKLEEFNSLLTNLGGASSACFPVRCGDMSVLPGIKYIITTDADTILPRGSARRLVGTLAHPLNQPVFDPVTHQVIAGYSVLQPRVQVRPASANLSWFTRIFSGDTEMDLYSRAVSDVYQDLFGEGSYVGKGIYDLAAFERCLRDRVPENTILSHDMFEGLHGRCGLVTDIVLFEDYPPHYLAYTSRMHRWVRGDWQLLPWLLPDVPVKKGSKLPNDLSTLDRWKIFDNLRRSLTPPFMLVLLAGAWFFLPGSAVVWTFLTFSPFLLTILTSFLSSRPARKPDDSPANSIHSIRQMGLRLLFEIILLPYESLVIADAVATTLVRLIITRKRLLQWITSAHSLTILGRELKVALVWRQMFFEPLYALFICLVMLFWHPEHLAGVSPLLLCWFISPYIVVRISQLSRRPVVIPPESGKDLHRLARLTWLFFERFVGPEDHWLPPDHFQEDPRGQVAHRTSPTNIGLLLLSSLSAYDLGYIGPQELAVRLHNSFETLRQLQGARGHFFNWYDTHTLAPLLPRYISTVDSGNLAACFLVLRQGLKDITNRPVINWSGLVDTLDMLLMILEEAHLDSPSNLLYATILDVRGQASDLNKVKYYAPHILLTIFAESQAKIEAALINIIENMSEQVDQGSLNRLATWVDRTRYHLEFIQRDLQLLVPWSLSMTNIPALFELPAPDPGSSPDSVPHNAAFQPYQRGWQELQRLLSVNPKLEDIPQTCANAREILNRIQAGLRAAGLPGKFLQMTRMSQVWTNACSPDFSELAARNSSRRAEFGRNFWKAKRKRTDMQRKFQFSARAKALPPVLEEVSAWCQSFEQQLASASHAADALLADLLVLGEESEQFFRPMDFSFLFNAQRQIFHIGFNLESGGLDPNYYDLLASEARIASLIAICKDDAPLGHWLHLARPLTQVQGVRALLSWSSTMFEYLMPTLFLRSYPNTLLEQSCAAAVQRQIAYCKEKNVPWGISESSFYYFDANQVYQYRAFGVPGLGYKRGLEDDLVITPYASILALPFAPQAVIQNLDHLRRLNMCGEYGLYESIDFTAKRLGAGQEHAIVRSYMAHHQGMSLLALDNFLMGNKMVRRFHADPRIKNVELLLQEQTLAARDPGADELSHSATEDSERSTSYPGPRQRANSPGSGAARPGRSRKFARSQQPASQPADPFALIASVGALGRRPLWQSRESDSNHPDTLQPPEGAGWTASQSAPYPQVHSLTSGNYSLLITATGSGFSRWGDFDLTRWRADTTLDHWGQWLYIYEKETGQLWSSTSQPIAAAPSADPRSPSASQQQSVQFYPHRVEFERRDHDISIHTSVTVAPGADSDGDSSSNAALSSSGVEIRHISITNHGDRPRVLLLTSYAEVILAAQDVDRRHPAFNRMFIESEFVKDEQIILFHRRLRAMNEKTVYLAHFVTFNRPNQEPGLFRPNQEPGLFRPNQEPGLFRPNQEPGLFRPNQEPGLFQRDGLAGKASVSMLGYETDRARFLGTGGTVRAPLALRESLPDSAPVPGSLPAARDGGLSCSSGATLDPIMAIQTRIVLEPFGSVQLAVNTLAAPSRKEAIELAHRYHSWNAVLQAFESSAQEVEDEMARLNLTSRDLERIEKLLSALLYTSPVLRADPEMLASNTLSQPGLWPFAISGDYPILLIRIGQEDQGNLALLGEVLQAHSYWRRRGLKIDLVIVNLRATSYDENLSGQINRLLEQSGGEAWLNKRGGIFVLREDILNPAEKILLATAARVVLSAEAGTLEEQLRKLDRQPVRLPHFIAIHSPAPSAGSEDRVERPENLLFDNGLGGFSPDGKEYQIYLEPGQWTPAPRINVIANPTFGFLVSNNGMGCTWSQNSGENRLTPWHNDPVSDPPSEAIYLRDEDTGQIWSPTPLPVRAEAPYLIRHGQGYSVFEHASHGLKQSMRLWCHTSDPVKVIQLKLENKTNRTRRINITYYAEWVLGNSRDTTSQYIIPEFDSRRFALLAHNPFNNEFSQNVAFLAATRELNWVTTDRSEFLGLLGSYAHPAALERVGLTASVQAGSDPCAAMQILLWLAPHESKEVTFLLGQGHDRAEAEGLIVQYQNVANISAAGADVETFWEHNLAAIQVETPDPSMNIMLNRWLLYQALACRIWGRTALYQSSGAFGFRDQLQDVLALLHARPDLVRAHILDACGHQFEQGDVLHWWHPSFPGTSWAGRGIRTRISDNLFWLPYVTAQYVKVSGDVSILSQVRPFLCAGELQEGEDERYGQYFWGEQTATLHEHCLRAIQKGLTSGKHGLPLMGSGDWNDGMNRVGLKGKGESVWLGWFACAVLQEYAVVCDQFEPPPSGQAQAFRVRADELRQALEACAWDGDWYRRAYFDDGTALGSIERGECQIDSISQSWAVISQTAHAAADPGLPFGARAQHALDSLYRRLVRPDDQVILLLDPPFNFTLRDPGYIKGYPPGIRENGGQYTHAAVWAVWAFAALGQGDRAVELFDMLNPIKHADTPEKTARYRVEPYVIAADVYSVPPHNGRGGWTWYSGSASWMYRLGVEAILGVQREGDRLRITPAIPKGWPSYKLTYRFGKTEYAIQVQNPQHVSTGVACILLDGKTQPENVIPLQDDGVTHHVTVILGSS